VTRRSLALLIGLGLGLLSLSLTACAESPTSRPSPSAVAPGRPYDASEVLAAMRESRRPGGVPDQLETDVIASAVAALLWTWDGAPWEELAVGGACGPASCSLEVVGAPAGASGTDLYSLSVDPATGSVELTASDLHGVPAALEAELDALVRAGVAPERLEGMQLVGVRWHLAPDVGSYELAYRSGGEEGAPGLDIVVDREAGSVLEVTPVS
jgi:hypothetical protein